MSEAEQSYRWLFIVRFGWLVVALIGLVMFVVGVPLHYQLLIVPCDGTGCLSAQQLTLEGLASLDAIGITIQQYAAIQLGFVILVAVVFTGTGLLIFWKRSHEVMALVSSLWLVTLGLTLFEGEVRSVALVYPWTAPIANGLIWLGGVFLLVLFFYLFPNGRFASRWSKWASLGLPIVLLGVAIIDWVSSTSQIYEAIGPAIWGMMILVGIGFQIFRYRRVSNASERQQTKWVMFALLVTFAALAFMVWSQTTGGASVSASTSNVVEGIILVGVMALGFLAIPIGIGISILRYRLYDIDIIIRRTVQYVLISAVLAVVYFGSITVMQGAISAVAQTQSPIAIVLSTLLIAALFNPLRRRVQAVVDRRFYRQKYNAEQVLAQFAQTARDETDMDALQAELLRVVQETIQPEQVGVWLNDKRS